MSVARLGYCIRDFDQALNCVARDAYAEAATPTDPQQAQLQEQIDALNQQLTQLERAGHQ